MKESETLPELPKYDTVTQRANIRKNGAEGLAWGKVVTNIRFVKNTIICEAHHAINWGMPVCLLLCNKLPQNSAALSNKLIISQGVRVRGPGEWLSLWFRLRESWKIPVKISTRASVTGRLGWDGKICFQDDSLSWLLPGGWVPRHMDFPNMAAGLLPQWVTQEKAGARQKPHFLKKLSFWDIIPLPSNSPNSKYMIPCFSIFRGLCQCHKTLFRNFSVLLTECNHSHSLLFPPPWQPLSTFCLCKLDYSGHFV